MTPVPTFYLEAQLDSAHDVSLGEVHQPGDLRCKRSTLTMITGKQGDRESILR